MNHTLALRFLIAIIFVATCAIPTGATASKPLKSKAKTAVSAPPGPSYAQRLDALAAASDIADSQQLEVAWVRQMLAQARYIPAIAKAVLPPAVGVAKNWRAYRSRFIEPIRIRAGVAFWQAHSGTLLRAEAQTGVPMEIIVGILGIETIYGQNMGSFRVIDALATLAFDFPSSHPRAAQRSAYFKSELASYLGLMQRNKIDPLSLRGSYAGAMGMPQFMPSSWANYAVDDDGDGRIDLFGSPADAIGSVAHYLQAFGWQKGLATHYPLSFDAARLDLPGLLAPDILPTFSTDELQAKGVVLDALARQHSGKLALIELQNGDAAPSYVAGSQNFYAVTRYNWSSYYALAVIELGQAVMQAAGQSSGQ